MSPRTSIESGKPSPEILQVLLLDSVAAFLAASVASPLVAVIDDSVVRRAVRLVPLAVGLKEGALSAVKTPLKFIHNGTFGLVFMVFAGTYLAANWADTLGKHYTTKFGHKVAAIEAGLPKFFLSTVANSGLSIYRDICITRKHSSAPPAPVPGSSYAFFLCRDLISMAAAFNGPDYVSVGLQSHTSWSVNQCDIVSQCTIPVVGQFLISPFHLAGIQSVNVGGSKQLTFKSMMSFVKENYIGTTSLRMIRMLPAFGFGGVANNLVRKNRQRQQF